MTGQKHLKTAFVLEGGAMRGMYTVGVLDVMMDNNIEIDCIVGTSAGALFGPNYFSKQRGRAIRYNKKFCKDRRNISFLSLIFTGNIVNKKFAYYKITKGKRIFKMAPIHHHFQMCGYSEAKIGYIYQIITLMIGLSTIALTLLWA